MIEKADMAYCGEPIVEADAFLRDLPIGVSLEDRLRLHAVVFASDIIVRAFNDLRDVTCAIGSQIKQYNNEHLVVLISSCWTIVDQLHTCRQFLFQASRKKPGPLMKEFLNRSEQVLPLRNKMDHLKDNIGNLARAQGKLGPLAGMLSYLYSGSDPGTECHSISVGTGALRQAMNFYKIDPSGKTVNRPVDHFEFTAFERTLEICPALASLKHLLEHTSNDISEQYRLHLEQLEQNDPQSTKNFSNAGIGLITILETFQITA
jgi:hypothetical protein